MEAGTLTASMLIRASTDTSAARLSARLASRRNCVLIQAGVRWDGTRGGGKHSFRNVDTPPCCRGNSEPGVRRHCAERDKRKVRAELVRLSNRYLCQIYSASHNIRASQHTPRCRRPSRSPEQSGGRGKSSKTVRMLSPFHKISVPHLSAPTTSLTWYPDR